MLEAFNIINHTFYNGRLNLRDLVLSYELCNGEDDWVGYYDMPDRCIYLEARFLSEDQIITNLVHEISHLVHHQIFSKDYFNASVKRIKSWHYEPYKKIDYHHGSVFEKINKNILELFYCLFWQEII